MRYFRQIQYFFSKNMQFAIYYSPKQKVMGYCSGLSADVPPDL